MPLADRCFQLWSSAIPDQGFVILRRKNPPAKTVRDRNSGSDPQLSVGDHQHFAFVNAAVKLVGQPAIKSRE